MLTNRRSGLQEGFNELPIRDASYHAQRSMKSARKAIYALGLDFGMVHIGITPKGHTIVKEVRPTPLLNRRLAKLFGAAIRRYAEELEDAAQEGAASLLLGADPEFALRTRDGRIAVASRFMGREGTVGCDAVVMRSGELLLPLVELRPAPAADPRRLVGHLRRTMDHAHKLILDSSLTWLAGSMPFRGLPLGGHIHFSGIWLNTSLLRALDNYLALPLLMLEDTRSANRRPRYGFLGDYRRQPHGGFEYRVLPSWLISPELTFCVLTLARFVALQYRRFRHYPLDHPDLQQSFYRRDKAKLLPVVRLIWGELEQASDYIESRQELAWLKKRVFSLQEWDEDEDVRRFWKIAPYGKREGFPRQFMI